MVLSIGTLRYLAVVHGGHKLIGPQRELRPLIEVHPAAHVVQVLEEGHRHCSGTSAMDAKMQFKKKKS